MFPWDWWPGSEGRSTPAQLLEWTVFVTVLAAVFVWETYDSPFFLFGLVFFVPFIVVFWAIGWGLIVIFTSESRRSQMSDGRCPACAEPVTESQPACSWCGEPLASGGRTLPGPTTLP